VTTTSKAFPLVLEAIADSEVVDAQEVPLEMASKQYLTGRDLEVSKFVELRQNPQDADFPGSTLEVTFNLRGTGLTYKTATNLAIFPENSEDDVKLVAQLLKADLNQRFVFKTNPNVAKRSTAAKHPFPTPCTVREALTKFVDLRGALRKKLLTDLASHCADESEKQKLQEIASNKDLFAEIESNQYGLIDIL
jgi:NADPH-ferrihemoprotein reductase